MSEPLSPERYVAASGRRCPACLGMDLERRHVDQAAPGSMTRSWRCETCGATWTAIYKLTGYDGLCQRTEETP